MDITSQHWPEWTSACAYLAEPTNRLPARTARRIVTLERDSPRLVKTASRAGVEITYLGIAETFAEHKAYSGQETDWIVGPASSNDTVVPLAEQQKLQELLDAGIDFRLVYFAHEIPKGRIAALGEAMNTADRRPVALDRQTATQAIGPVPPPSSTSALTQRLAKYSQRMLDTLGAAVPVAGAIVTAPFALAGAALAAGLDPIIFGVIPAGPPVPRQPAAWYALAQWTWPAAPNNADSGGGRDASL